jgi:hypothetical protein
MTTVWQISQMERTLADGGVVVCHWRANIEAQKNPTQASGVPW